MNKLKSSPYFILWLILTLISLVLSAIVILVNYYTCDYTGNNYFPNNTLQFGLFCILLLLGAKVLNSNSKDKALSQFSTELLLFFLTMVAIIYAVNAIQLTPFPLVDSYLILFDKSIGFSLTQAMQWAYQHPYLHNVLMYSYATQPMQMAFLPILMMAANFFYPDKHLRRIRRYFCLMLLTTIIGFTIYYFFPTAAPAAFLKSPYFTNEQYATGLKLMQIRHYIPPTTLNGGLIAFPSHHTIWAILCLYLLYPYKIAFSILLINNCFLIAACVLLGWHYPMDIIAAILIVWISFQLTKNDLVRAR